MDFVHGRHNHSQSQRPNAKLILGTEIVFRCTSDLSQFGYLTRPTLIAFDGLLPFDSFPLYAIIHELCYLQGYTAACFGIGVHC